MIISKLEMMSTPPQPKSVDVVRPVATTTTGESISSVVTTSAGIDIYYVELGPRRLLS